MTSVTFPAALALLGSMLFPHPLVASPLHEAAQNGDVAAVVALLDNGASTEEVDASGYRPLAHACMGGHSEVVKLLLRRGADVNAISPDDATALVGAIRNNHPSIVRLLLEHGASRKALGTCGQSPLAWAASDGNMQAAAILLEYGANIDEGAGHSCSRPPLSWAAVKGHAGMVAFLLNAGAQVNTRMASGTTALFEASLHRQNENVIELLLDHGAVLDTPRASDCSILYWVVMNSPRAARSLLDHGADPNSSCGPGSAPVHVAAAAGDQKLVELLASRGAKINTRAPRGSTVLHAAARQGSPQLLRWLVEHGAAVNATMDDGRTALHVAALHENSPALRTLLELGADPTIKTTAGLTPADWSNCIAEGSKVFTNSAPITKECATIILERWPPRHGHLGHR